MKSFAAESEAALGAASMLVNNAGQGRVSTFADTDDQAWSDELDLKFFRVIRPTRAFLPQLRGAARRPGRAAIVCVNSLLALPARAAHGRDLGRARRRAEPGALAGDRVRARSASGSTRS